MSRMENTVHVLLGVHVGKLTTGGFQWEEVKTGMPIPSHKIISSLANLSLAELTLKCALASASTNYIAQGVQLRTQSLECVAEQTAHAVS